MPSKDTSSPQRKPLRVGALQTAAPRPSSASSPSPAAATPMVAEAPGIDSAKATPPPAYEFLGNLPDSYGTRKLFLVARDPAILFAYWDLDPVQYQEASRVADDGKIFLELYVRHEGRVQQIHVWDSHKNWYLQVNRPDTQFIAQLGYYRGGIFEVIARSAEVRTPRDDLSPNTDARFVTIPFHLSFQDLYELISGQVEPGEELAETLARLEKSNFEFPFQARIPRDLTEEESTELFGYVGDEEQRRRMVGSFEITEMLRKRYENALSSGQWTSSAGAWVTSVSSPFGASFGKARGFHMHVNAELIIYGGTEPSAKLRIDGQNIALSKDGTFAYHFVFPDGQFHIPVEATSADGVETRSALLSFARMTDLAGDVRKTGQPVVDEPIGRKP